MAALLQATKARFAAAADDLTMAFHRPRIATNDCTKHDGEITMSATAIPVIDHTPAERHPLAVPVEFLISDSRTGHDVGSGAGELLDISETGLALWSHVSATQGDSVVLYVEGLGRFVGQVARVFEGGFGVSFFLSPRSRDLIRKRIEGMLQGVPYFRIVEARKNYRFEYNIESSVRVASHPEPVLCTIIDMSNSGCLVACTVRPALGEQVAIGILRGAVVRHTDNGFAVAFGHKQPSSTAAPTLTGR